MLRLIGFFVVVFLVMQVLRVVLGPVPVVGAVFRMPLIGFWVTALLVSAVASKVASDAIDRRQRSRLVRELGAVDTPYNAGKLGALYASQGRAAKAIPYLEKAIEGEPEIAEWHYRLGASLLARGDREGAVTELERALEIDGEHAYGAARMRYVEALAGHPERQLEQLDRFERDHGENPESAYRRGVVLRSIGRKDEARAAFARVSEIARQQAQYQKKSAMTWVLKASLARLG